MILSARSHNDVRDIVAPCVLSIYLVLPSHQHWATLRLLVLPLLLLVWLQWARDDEAPLLALLMLMMAMMAMAEIRADDHRFPMSQISDARGGQQRLPPSPDTTDDRRLCRSACGLCRMRRDHDDGTLTQRSSRASVAYLSRSSKTFFFSRSLFLVKLSCMPPPAPQLLSLWLSLGFFFFRLFSHFNRLNWRAKPACSLLYLFYYNGRHSLLGPARSSRARLPNFAHDLPVACTLFLFGSTWRALALSLAVRLFRPPS